MIIALGNSATCPSECYQMFYTQNSPTDSRYVTASLPLNFINTNTNILQVFFDHILPFLLAPPCGQDFCNHPNSTCLQILLSGICVIIMSKLFKSSPFNYLINSFFISWSYSYGNWCNPFTPLLSVCNP